MRENQKTARGGRGSRRNSRPTIGLFVENTASRGAWYQTAVWAGVADAAQGLDVNLISFAGGALVSSPLNKFEVQRNLLYDLVTQGSVDGLIISGSLGSYAPREKFRGFCDRYRSFLPVVSIAAPLPDIPSVLVDNQEGVREAVRHLIKQHSRHRIAFIQGPLHSSEAGERYEAYREALVELGLSLDSSLIVPGNFEHDSGSQAIDTLLDQRKVTFDAVLAANDYMAFGALERLKGRGMQVPKDVAVVGFDGVEEGRASTPPLTTVQQPVHQQAKRAVEMLLNLLEGGAPEPVILPTKLEVRESCGCMAPEVAKAQAKSVNGGQAIGEILAAEWEGILPEMMQAAGVPATGMNLERMRVLLDAFSDELKEECPGIFLSMLYGLLDLATEGGDVAAWQDAISALRCKTLACLGDGEALACAEDLCQQARVMIAQAAQRVEAQRWVQAEQQAVLLREIGEKLITTVEAEGLMDVVANELPRLGIPRCYISLYESDSGKATVRSDGLPGRATEEGAVAPGNSRLILAYDERGRRQEAEGQVFPSRQLVPGGALNHERHYSIVVEPLHFREDQLGFALFEMGPRDGVIYEALRGQISSALKGALLYQETRIGEERLRSFYKASNALVSSQVPRQVLHDIVEQARVAADSMWVSAVLVDEMGQARDLATAGRGRQASVADVMRPNGLSMQVMRTGQAEVIEDTGMQQERLNPAMLERGVKAALCLPLAVKGERLGVVWFHYDKPRRFSTPEIGAAQLYVNQAALAYDSAQRISESEHMRQAAEALAGAADLQQVLEQIVQSAREVSQADSAAIWSYDDVRDEFIPENSVSSGISPELWQEFRQEEPRRGRTAYTVMEKGWVAVSDVDDTERYGFLGESTRRLLDQTGVRSFQGITLTVAGENLGVLYVNYNSPRSFREKEQEIAHTLANHAALALKKARLLEQVNKARNAATVVAEVTVLEDLKGTLDSIVRGTKDALDSDAVTLYTYDQDRGKLGYPPVMIGVRYPEKVAFLFEVPRHSIIFEVLQRDEPYVVEETTVHPDFKNRRFVIEEGVKSCVAIPLKVGDHKVGVMFVNYRSYHHFTADELTNIGLFANQAAVAIRHAQLYEETTRRANALRAVYEAGKAVTSTLALDEILNHIVEQASLLTAAHSGEQARFCYLALKEGSKLRFQAMYPPSHLPGSVEGVYVIDLEHDKAIGISGRAVETGESQLVPDVTQDPDYVPGNMESRSELAVPIRLGKEMIGVIDVEHPKPDAFDEEDQRCLEFLAAQAAIAIHNAQQYEELGQTKGLVGARTALAWMGMTSSAWRHTIDKHARTIGEQIGHLREELARALRPNDCSRINGRLSMIQRLARQIEEKPITPPLSAEEGVHSVAANDLIRERTKQLWQNEPYRSISLQLNLTLDGQATVRASPEWLRRALDVLVDNAVDAVADSPRRQVTIDTSRKGKQIEILVRDTGKGIPEEVYPHLFLDPIEKPKGTKGLGMGLLMAQVIVQTYRGEIGVDSTSPTGTTMFIRLPIEI